MLIFRDLTQLDKVVIFRDTQAHYFIIICIWSNHTKCKFLISALSNYWTSGHPAPPPSPPRPPRLSSPPGLLLRTLPRSILHRSRPEETCASTPFGLDLKNHHRGTKTQNFPGSNFPRAKTFRTTRAKGFFTTSPKSNFRSRHSHKVRNHCSWSKEKHIFFLQNRFFNVFLIILCFPWYISHLVFFSSNLTQLRHFSEDFEIIWTFQYILKQSDWKVSDHLEISGKFWKCLEYVKLVGNV